MKVKDLICELKNFDEDMEVVFQTSNSMYADSIYGAKKKELSSFYGKDRDVLVIVSGGQVGAVN